MATIVVLGALDTKGEEVRFLTRQIEEREHKVLVVDTGVLGTRQDSSVVTLDLDGRPRDGGTAPDIGCCER